MNERTFVLLHFSGYVPWNKTKISPLWIRKGDFAQ